MSKVIIVEGKKDARTLIELGFSNVVEIKGPLFSFVEAIAGKYEECIVLTDLDKEGRRLYHFLKSSLIKNGVKIDDRLRNFLFSNTYISNIEGLPFYLERDLDSFKRI